MCKGCSVNIPRQEVSEINAYGFRSEEDEKVDEEEKKEEEENDEDNQLKVWVWVQNKRNF